MDRVEPRGRPIGLFSDDFVVPFRKLPTHRFRLNLRTLSASMPLAVLSGFFVALTAAG
jgi:hypothetical protein